MKGSVRDTKSGKFWEREGAQEKLVVKPNNTYQKRTPYFLIQDNNTVAKTKGENVNNRR